MNFIQTFLVLLKLKRKSRRKREQTRQTLALKDPNALKNGNIRQTPLPLKYEGLGKSLQPKWGDTVIPNLHEKLRSFVPCTIFAYHAKNINQDLITPLRQEFQSVCMFVDVSGFTKMSEALASNGARGPEDLSFYLNRYFERITKLIARSGGDVFKFAGDAMLVLWPPQSIDDPHRMRRPKPTDRCRSMVKSPKKKEGIRRRDPSKSTIGPLRLQPELKPTKRQSQWTPKPLPKEKLIQEKTKKMIVSIHRAVQCSMDIQSELHQADLREGIQLSVKIGIGAGTATILHVGGVFGRLEYLACGPALMQAFSCEEQAKPGDTIVHQEAWEHVKTAFEGIRRPANTFKVLRVLDRVRNRSVSNEHAIVSESDGLIMGNRLKKYVPNAIIPHLELDRKLWSGELRLVTILFVSIGYDLGSMKRVDKNSMATINELIRGIQRGVYKYQGSLNKFLCDDKGSTLIAVCGLPPLSHDNDAARGVLTAINLKETMGELGIKCAIGVTSGYVYCGIVGSGSSREYGILGDLVNLSARLMSKAKSITKTGILCDISTQSIVPPGDNCCVEFLSLPPIMVKGKTNLIKIFEPRKKRRQRVTIVEHRHLPTVGRTTVLPILSKDIVRTIDTGKGRVVLLLGEIGAGKTHLLHEVAYSCRKYFPATCQAVWGRAREFEENENYVWETIMIKILGTPFDEQNEKEIDAHENKIRGYFKEHDTERRFYYKLHAFNHILGTSFKPADSRTMVKASQPDVVSIVLFVLRNAARHKTVALFLDELQNMSEYGWALTSSIAKAIKDCSIAPKNQRFKGVTMICACRDLFNVKFTPRFQPTNKHYAELRRHIAHEVLNLRILNTKEVTNYLKIYFNAEDICPVLLDFVMDRTGGNPRFCSLLASNLPMEVTKVRGLTRLAFCREFEKRMRNEFWSEVPADISSIVMDGADRVDARKMILLKCCATLLRGNPRYPLTFDSKALKKVHPVPEYIPYLAQDLACLVQANFLVDVTNIGCDDRRAFLVKKRGEDPMATFNGIMGIMDQALLNERSGKGEKVPAQRRESRACLTPPPSRRHRLSTGRRTQSFSDGSHDSFSEASSDDQLTTMKSPMLGLETFSTLDTCNDGDIYNLGDRRRTSSLPRRTVLRARLKSRSGSFCVNKIQSQRRESLNELFTMRRQSKCDQLQPMARRKKRFINTSYWEARVCFVKEEWFWWADSALDEENTVGRVCFMDKDTDFSMDLKNPFINIREKDVTYTFKTRPSAMLAWHEALTKAKEIGERKRLNNEPRQNDPPAFSELKSVFLFDEKPPYKTQIYAFNSGYLRDVIYNLMLFKQRELVHGACVVFFKETAEDPNVVNKGNIITQRDSHQRHIQMYRNSASVEKRGRQIRLKTGIFKGGLSGIIIDRGKKLIDSIKTRGRTNSCAVHRRRRMTHVLDDKMQPAEAIRMRQQNLSPNPLPSTPANEEQRASLFTKFNYIQELIKRRELCSESNYQEKKMVVKKSVNSTNQISLPNSPHCMVTRVDSKTPNRTIRGGGASST